MIYFLFCCWLAFSSGASLTASPSVLNSSGDNITISWSDLENPTVNDFIAIFSPSSSSNYREYIYLGGKRTTYTIPVPPLPKGSLIFPLVNRRADYIFKLVGENGTSVVATSNRVTFKSIDEPIHGHLALDENANEMRVMWTSNSGKTPVVKYGTASGKLDNVVYGSSYTYNISEMCDKPANTSGAWIDPGYINDAVIPNLKPGTRYYYQFGTPSQFSQEYSFIGPPTSDATVTHFVFGDLGVNPPYQTREEQQPPSSKTVYWISREIDNNPQAYQMVLNIGDIAYARGYAYLWDLFFHQIQPVAARIPWMVSIGNHEFDFLKQSWRPPWSDYGNDSGGECGRPYFLRFHMPQTSGPYAPPDRNLWYVINHGPIHYVMLSTEHNFLEGSDQWNWLQNDLANVDRAKTPWVIVTGHRPMYSSDIGALKDVQNAKMRSAIEPLLVKYKVDLCLWGHVHTYERTCNMYNFQCDPRGPIHLVIGNAGNIFQPGWYNILNFML